MSLTLATRAPHRHSQSDTPPVDPVRSWLAALPVLELSPFAPRHLRACGSDVSTLEAATAARAAACPDLFVVHSPDPHTGERVIAELAHLTTAGNDRVVVLSPNPVTADRLVERLVRANVSGVVRALADDENPARPSPLVARVTSACVLESATEQLKREASAAVAAADAKLTSLEKLIERAEQLANLDAELAETTARRNAIEPAVRAETGTPLAERLAAIQAAHEQTRTRLTDEARTVAESRKATEVALTALRQQHAEATADTAKKPGFFSRLLGKPKHGHEAVDLEKQIQSREAEITATHARVAELETQLGACARTLVVDREKAVQEEIALRAADLDARIGSLLGDQQRLRAEVELDARAIGVTPAAQPLADARYAATRELVQSRERLTEVTRTATELARDALHRSQIVVGTPGSVFTDAVFARTGAASGPPFSVLVLDRAEELGEPDFVQFSRLAERWVLVGDAPVADEPKPHLNGTRHAPGRNGRDARPAPAPFAARIARVLDRETWLHEPDRLVCRRAFLTPEQRRELVREPLLDNPNIELRFISDDTGELNLAEVVFPAGTPVPDAKSFLFHELGEVLLRPCGEVVWHSGETAVTACWPRAEHANAPATWIELEPGVREKIVGAGALAFTAAVAFELAHGWDTQRAAAWLADHAPEHSTSRYAALPNAAVSTRRPLGAG